MAYSTEVVRRARERLVQKKADRESRNNARLEEVYTKLPRVRQIDNQLRATMVRAAQAVFSQGGGDAIEEAKKENLALQEERRRLLAENFSENYLDAEPVCPKCGGAGYIGSAMCDCLKSLCAEEQKKELGQVFSGKESFSSFSLDYYSDAVNPQLRVSPRTVMEKTLSACRFYARTFRSDSGNLLLSGGTGLGKTHLALAMGRAIGEMGNSVCYESAISLFNKLEKARFNPTEESRREAERLESCDLLIIDDLGTEMPGQFVTAALYGLLEGRLMGGRPMIITTNLNVDEVGRRYSPQIASRLYGQFLRLTFIGSDIRAMKNR